MPMEHEKCLEMMFYCYAQFKPIPLSMINQKSESRMNSLLCFVVFYLLWCQRWPSISPEEKEEKINHISDITIEYYHMYSKSFFQIQVKEEIGLYI